MQMVSYIKKNAAKQQSSMINKIHGLMLANKRRIIKRTKSLIPNSKYHRSFQEVRFPSLNEQELQKKISKFAQIINSPSDIKIKQVSPHIFLVQ